MGSEVSSTHEAAELDGPEQRRRRTARAAVRRGGWHLGAADEVRRRGCRSSGSGTAAGAANRCRCVRKREPRVRSGGDTAIRLAATLPETVEQVLGRPAKRGYRGHLLGLAGRLVVVANLLCLGRHLCNLSVDPSIETCTYESASAFA